jgi:hypothetical protein
MAEQCQSLNKLIALFVKDVFFANPTTDFQVLFIKTEVDDKITILY